jgi:hypothetical protein
MGEGPRCRGLTLTYTTLSSTSLRTRRSHTMLWHSANVSCGRYDGQAEAARRAMQQFERLAWNLPC